MTICYEAKNEYERNLIITIIIEHCICSITNAKAGQNVARSLMLQPDPK